MINFLEAIFFFSLSLFVSVCIFAIAGVIGYATLTWPAMILASARKEYLQNHNHRYRTDPIYVRSTQFIYYVGRISAAIAVILMIVLLATSQESFWVIYETG